MSHASCATTEVKTRVPLSEAPYGSVRVKLGLPRDQFVQVMPKYESCREVAPGISVRFSKLPPSCYRSRFLSRRVTTRRMVGATGLSRLGSGSANLPSLWRCARARAVEPRRGGFSSCGKKSVRQDSNSKPAPRNQGLATRDSQRDSHNSTIVDFDLQRVINAWPDLPANLKAAILAIVGSGSLSHW
jgi:hypothetical protein